MQLMHLSKALLTGVCSLSKPVFGLILSTMVVLPAAAQSNSLEPLPVATQEEISRVCLPVQYREGAGAYRNCVQTELNLRNNKGNSETTELAKLSFDDKYAVQQACAKAGGQSSANYQSCVTTQISELNAIEQPALQLISEDELYVVQQSCFDAQSKEGAAKYRLCLNGEVNSLLAIPAADTSKLNVLKKNALQLRCSSNASYAVQYRQCVASEFESIAGTAPSFLPVSTAAAVAKPNNNVQNSQSVNETVKKVAEKKQAEPETTPETTTVAASQEDTTQSASAVQVAANETTEAPATMVLPRNIKPPVSESSLSAADAKPIDIDQSDTTTEEIVVAQNSAADTEAITTANSDNNARVISKPELVKTLELQALAEEQSVDAQSDTSVSAQSPSASAEYLAKATALWQKFLNSLASLDRIGWLIIAGLLALPALMLGLFSFMRRIRTPVTDHEMSNPALAERIESGLQTRQLRHEQQAARLFEDETKHPQDNDHDAVTRMATKSERSGTAQPPAHLEQGVEQGHPMAAPALAETSTSQPGYVHLGEQSDEPNASDNSAWQSAFGTWLQQQPATQRTGACVEFLIYWVAYGDDRYEPELKKRLFTATNLSSHDEIKRWVLKQDVFAFSDVIVWLRENASQKQLDQTMGLILALLVTENSVTPVQNTLLRFLSDAFNIGNEKLEKRFNRAYGHPLPNIPRTDKLAWWAKQDDAQVQSWNARALASRPEKEQMMARLGLSPNFDDAQVISAFRRAARRCHPDRFTALGERERAMAEQQFIKFEQARDKLLGVSV